MISAETSSKQPDCQVKISGHAGVWGLQKVSAAVLKMRALKTETISEKLHVCCRCGGLSAGDDHDSARLIGQHKQPVIKTHT